MNCTVVLGKMYKASCMFKIPKRTSDKKTSFDCWSTETRSKTAADLEFGTLDHTFILMSPSKSWHLAYVASVYLQRVHEHVHRVLEGQCQPGRTRQGLSARLPASSQATQPFLWKDDPLLDDLFLYPPPFGFEGLRDKVENLLKQVKIFFSLFGLYCVYLLQVLMDNWHIM